MSSWASRAYIHPMGVFLILFVAMWALFGLRTARAFVAVFLLFVLYQIGADQSRSPRSPVDASAPLASRENRCDYLPRHERCS